MDKMIRISSEVHNSLKIEAAKRQTSMKDLAEKAIENILSEERQMSEQIKVIVKFSASGIDPDKILTPEHVDDYAESLRVEIEAEYPEAQVTVEEGIGNGVDVLAAPSWTTYSQIGSGVEQIMADHYQPWIDRVAGEL